MRTTRILRARTLALALALASLSASARADDDGADSLGVLSVQAPASAHAQ